jgi:hypothetical protein
VRRSVAPCAWGSSLPPSQRLLFIHQSPWSDRGPPHRDQVVTCPCPAGEGGRDLGSAQPEGRDRAVGLRHPSPAAALPPVAGGGGGRAAPRGSGKGLREVRLRARGHPPQPGHDRGRDRPRHPALREVRRGQGRRQADPQPGQEGRRRDLGLRHERGPLALQPEAAREPRDHGLPGRGVDAEGGGDARDGGECTRGPRSRTSWNRGCTAS